jgi:hypothetical protein
VTHPALALYSIAHDAQAEGRDADAAAILAQVDEQELAPDFEHRKLDYRDYSFVAGDTTNTVTLTSPLDAHNFVVGMDIGFGGSSAVVTGIDHGNGVITIDRPGATAEFEFGGMRVISDPDCPVGRAYIMNAVGNGASRISHRGEP